MPYDDFTLQIQCDELPEFFAFELAAGSNDPDADA